MMLIHPFLHSLVDDPWDLLEYLPKSLKKNQITSRNKILGFLHTY